MVPTRLLLPVLLPFLMLRSGSPADSAAAGEHARDIIDKALHDKNPDTRKQAAVALSLGGAREPFLSQLVTLLGDKDVETRMAAVASLSELKTKQTTAALRKALNDDAPEVSFAAAKALFGQNDPAGKAALLSVLSGETKVASSFLTKQKRDALRMMHTPRPMFMLAIRTGIGFAPVPGLGEGISSMQGILSDPGVSGRALAALLLGKERDEATRQALREALTDKDASVRAAAVHSLVLRNDLAFQADLVPLLEDKKESVRLRAAAGFLRLQLVRQGRNPGAASGRKKT
jgi:HEAT repeat protein